MLSHGGFTHCNSLSQNPIPKPILFPTKPHLNFVLDQVSKHKLPSFHGGIRTGFCVFASKTPKKIDKTLFPEIEEIEDEDVFILEDDDDEEEYDEDELFEGDDDGDDIDLDEMSGNYKAWLKSNKPRGFGEGKVYDTSLEDKLLEEIKQSKTAQSANLNKLKNSPQSSNSKKDSTKKQTAKETSPNGVPVRLTNLPKKKNIDRDLRAAFRGFPGILNIIPAVLGNKKTREPVCKGFAFVYFKSQNEANRFVELFTGQSFSFGKIQKQIKCEVIKSSSPNATDKPTVKKTSLPLLPVDPSSQVIIPQLRTNSQGEIDESVSKTQSYTGIIDNFTSLESVNFDTEKLEEKSVTDARITENFTLLESINVDSQELEEEESETDADPLENQKENEEKRKNFSSKKKGEKTRKTKSLGSANRLKFKEKTLLSGIVSKYGAKPKSPAK